MSWNYRIIKRVAGSETSYSIHEVYYGEGGRVTTWTRDPMHAFGESIQELRNDVTWFWSAFQKPILSETKDETGVDQLIEEGENQAINSGHWFEVMDRASVAMSHFDDFVASHPVVRKDPGFKKRAEEITNLMYALYTELAQQAIGENGS